MNRCPTCGTTYPADARFCTRDGTRLLGLGGAPIPPTPPLGTPTVGAVPTPRSTSAVSRQPSGPHVAHSNLSGQVLDGRYQIVRKVGEGGMSFVYLATDLGTRERYAIKVLSAALSDDENAMARLKREAALGMRLAHPNICQIIRMGETEDRLVYVVMPYVDGEILSDRTNRMGHIPLADTVRLVKDMAEGLHFAHQLKIVHRDLKPENVMVTRNPDGTDRAVVMDFGLAKERRTDAELQKLTATGIILGTPEFMSPEQLRGKPLDPRTDVYSLALLTFEMLTGKLPFEGRTQQELMIARLRSDPLSLRKVRPDFDFPEAVDSVLAKALKRNPDERFQSTVEFATALQSAAGENGGQGGLLGKLFGR
jgi:serine/threonine protein kinase